MASEQSLFCWLGLSWIIRLLIINRIMSMQYDQLYGQNRLSALALRNCGFEEAPASSLPYYLYNAELNQQASCLRDTLVLALRNYLKLQTILLQAGTAKKWKFYHIVLCSMPDKVSKIKHKETIEEIIRLNSMWQVGAFRTFFVPISMQDYAIEEIMRFCEFGGPDWVSYPTTYEDFHDQFKSVMAEVGIAGKHSLLGSESYQENLMEVNPFDTHSLALTLSVEASEMMRGPKWESIVNTISFYLRNLSRRDVMSGIIFSSQPWVVGQAVAQPEPRPEIAQGELMARLAERRNAREGQQEVRVQAPPPRQVQVQGHPQYAAYAAPVQQQQRGNAGRNCGYCCVVFCILFFIRLIIVLASS